MFDVFKRARQAFVPCFCPSCNRITPHTHIKDGEYECVVCGTHSFPFLAQNGRNKVKMR